MQSIKRKDMQFTCAIKFSTHKTENEKKKEKKIKIKTKRHIK
jgi:hypothetical protein